MEENKFEKDIRRELEGMKILPSEKSWASVEKRIGKKKRRRPIGLLLLLLALCISVGGYWLLHSKEQHYPGKIAEGESRIFEKNHLSKTAHPDTADAPEKAKQVDEQQKNTMQQQIFSQKQPPKKHSGNNRDGIYVEPLFSADKHEPALYREENIRIQKVAPPFSVINEKGLNQKPVDTGLVHHLETNTLPGPITHKTDKNSAGISKVGNVETTTSNSNKLQTNQKKRKWTLGFTFSAGSAYVRNSLFGIFSEEKNAAPSNQYDPGSAGGGQRPDLIPSMPQHSLAFAGGVVATRPLTLRSELSVGIRYKYFSTTNRVGSPVSNFSDYYYSNSGPKKMYRNRFHFIELPVKIEVQLTKKNQLPVHWNAGIHVAQLIASNALQFSSGRYFNDNSFFNKTQIGFSTGVDVTLFAKEKFPVSIGPSIYYGISEIADKGLYGNTHFSFIGLQGKILFRRKE